MKYGTIKTEQAEAARCKLERFHCSVPCKKCEGSIRSTATGDCLECKKAPPIAPKRLATRDMNVSTVSDMLVFTRGNQAEVARLLNITRTTLRKVIIEKRPNVILVESSGGKFTYRLLM